MPEGVSLSRRLAALTSCGEATHHRHWRRWHVPGDLPLPPINPKTVPQASCPRVCPNRGGCLPSRLVERQPTIGLGADE